MLLHRWVSLTVIVQPIRFRSGTNLRNKKNLIWKTIVHSVEDFPQHFLYVTVYVAILHVI